MCGLDMNGNTNQSTKPTRFFVSPVFFQLTLKLRASKKKSIYHTGPRHILRARYTIPACTAFGRALFGAVSSTSEWAITIGRPCESFEWAAVCIDRAKDEAARRLQGKMVSLERPRPPFRPPMILLRIVIYTQDLGS